MAFAQGDILVLPFPYSDQLAEKRRPALVVSKPALERTHGLIWVAMITSHRGQPRPDDVVITQKRKAGLPGASLIRPSKLATIEPARVVRKAGAVSRADLTAALNAIAKYL
ncbi:MAG: type II toxin-antitoxin system PemK/MazF family toxin [Proteobacteria bacterium]|nr:type II toxin-antitoxin system PemK/MazF family toxin [Pseudomonadota bacterium]